MLARWPVSPAKRLVDVVVSAAVLVLTAPVTAVVAVLVRKEMGSPVLFRHDRAGKDGEPFTMIKFRSMTDPFDADGNEVPEDERITPLGHFLRNSSLDELPELINVLRGEMSLIGPRPLLLQYRERYSPEQALRLKVRPGITGLAQVSGRNAIEWSEKFRLDVDYVRNGTWRTDVSIVARTVSQVLKRDGVSAEGHTSSPIWLGDEASTDPAASA